MRSNRFDFLEFGEPDPNVGDGDRASDGVKGTPSGKLPDLGDGLRLSQVRVEKTQVEEVVDDQPHDPWEKVGKLGHRLVPIEITGARGSGAGEFMFPAGIAIDRKNVIYVADAFNHRLQRLTPDGGAAVIGQRGTARGQFATPMGGATDDACSFYTIEQGNCRVQKFTRDGVLVLVFGKPGSRPGEMRNPVGIAVSRETKEILVADSANNRVQRFEQSGRFIAMLGAGGKIQPPIINPQAIAVDNYGHIFVSDPVNNRITVFDPLGKFMGTIGGGREHAISALAANIQFSEPHALTCTDYGTLFVTDGQTTNGRLIAIEIASGRIEDVVDRPQKNLGRLARPSGAAIAPSSTSGGYTGDVFVSDTVNHRLIRYTWK